MRITKVLSASIFCLVAGFAIAGRAQAACSGAALTNPLNLLNGTSWAFHTHDGYGDAEIGVFTLTVQPPTMTNPYTTGVLNGTETSVSGSLIQRGIQLTGKYQVSSDCLWGTLIFTGTATNYQYAFVNTGTELWLVNDSRNMPNNSNGQVASSRGTAVLLSGQPQCPAGVSPNSVFAGTWYFEDYNDDTGGASIGTFIASVPAASYRGLMNGTYTSTNQGIVTVNAPLQGSYEVYSDCSGGTFTELVTFTPNFDFVFAGPGKIFYLNDSSGVPLAYAREAVMAP